MNRGIDKEFEVALSFAGEQRSYVEEVARHLSERGVRVFYDGFESARLWGKDLAELFHRVFEDQSRFVVMFISQAYVDKLWPNFERKAALSHMVQETREYILPVRFDDTPVPGLPSNIGYLNANEYKPAQLAALIAEKLGIQPFGGKASQIPPPRKSSLFGEVVFDYSNHNGRYVIGSGILEFETMWSKAGSTSIHIYNDPPSINAIAIAKGCESISQVKSGVSLDFTSRYRTLYRGQVAVLRNTNGFYAAVHVLEIQDDSRNHEKDECRFRFAIQPDGTDNFSKLAGNYSV